jgi:ER lumen protein retaining receptor
LMELLWTFSICLEPLAILPQLFLVFQYRDIQSVTWIYEYILFKGAYRALYIVNWIYRAHTEPHYRHHYLVYTCGVLQTLVYADFFQFYVTRYASKQASTSVSFQPCLNIISTTTAF